MCNPLSSRKDRREREKKRAIFVLRENHVSFSPSHCLSLSVCSHNFLSVHVLPTHSLIHSFTHSRLHSLHSPSFLPVLLFFRNSLSKIDHVSSLSYFSFNFSILCSLKFKCVCAQEIKKKPAEQNRAVNHINMNKKLGHHSHVTLPPIHHHIPPFPSQLSDPLVSWLVFFVILCTTANRP